MKPTSNFFYSVLLTSSVIFASAWFFCSSTLMILSDFNFSADHTQFDVQKQTVQLNREKGLTVVSISVENIFMVFIQFYFCLLLVLWLFFFPSGFSSFYFMLVLLERRLLFILSSARILALVFLLFLLIFVIFYLYFELFFVDTVSICTVIFADVSNLSRFTSTVFIDCYFFSAVVYIVSTYISCCLSFLRCCF